LDTGDLDASQVLTVTLALLVASLVLVLLDDDLGAAELVQDLSGNRNLRELLSVGGHGVAVDQEERGELNRLALLRLLTIEGHDSADLDLFLPATGAHNCVDHVIPVSSGSKAAPV